MDNTGFEWFFQLLKFLQDNIISLSSLFLVVFGRILEPLLKKYITKIFNKLLNKEEYDKNIERIETENEKRISESDEIQARAAATNVNTAMTLLEKQRLEFDKERILFMQKLNELDETVRVNGGINAEINNKYRTILIDNEEIKLTNKKIEDENILLSRKNSEITEKLDLIQKENAVIKEENQKTKNESLELHKENRQLKKTVDKLKNLISELQGFIKKLMLGIKQLIKAYEDDHKDKNIPWRPPDLTEKEERMLSDDYLKEEV